MLTRLAMENEKEGFPIPIGPLAGMNPLGKKEAL